MYLISSSLRPPSPHHQVCLHSDMGAYDMCAPQHALALPWVEIHEPGTSPPQDSPLPFGQSLTHFPIAHEMYHLPLGGGMVVVMPMQAL